MSDLALMTICRPFQRTCPTSAATASSQCVVSLSFQTASSKLQVLDWIIEMGHRLLRLSHFVCSAAGSMMHLLATLRHLAKE